jgi:hypothetical protein
MQDWVPALLFKRPGARPSSHIDTEMNSVKKTTPPGLRVTGYDQLEDVRRTHDLVRQALEQHAAEIHGGSVVVNVPLVLGNVLQIAPENFIVDGKPSLLGMRLCVERRAGFVLPDGAPPMPLRGLTQSQLDALLQKNRDFVVVRVSLAEERVPHFTGVSLSLVSLSAFCRIFGVVYRSRAEWTLPLICDAVLSDISAPAEGPVEVVLFTKQRAMCVTYGTAGYLLTSAFRFVLCGYPQMTNADLRATRRPRPQPAVVPEFFLRRGADRVITPAAGMVEWVLSLAHSTWRGLLPKGGMALALLKFQYGAVARCTKDPIRLAVCRFILRTRHETLMRLSLDEASTDLYAACDALRASLTMDRSVTEECPSPFLQFVKFMGTLAAPWTWVLRHFKAMDALIRDHAGCIPPRSQAKPAALDAQQLCDRACAVPAIKPEKALAPSDSGTIRDLMDIVERYLLVCWRRDSSDGFFDALHGYLLALRDPELRTFLVPRAWALYVQSAEGSEAVVMLRLAEHYLSPACRLFPGPVPWVVPEALLVACTASDCVSPAVGANPLRFRGEPADTLEGRSSRPRRKAPRVFLNPNEGATQLRKSAASL